MDIMSYEIIFWLSFFLLFYTYIGYGIILYFLQKGIVRKELEEKSDENLPTVTFLVAAYNEAEIIEEKLINTAILDYPKDKIQFLFVTDGSTDETVNIIKRHSDIELMHSPERKGKIAAVNRVMSHAKNEIVVFSDANAMLNKQAIRKIVRHYQDPSVGAVAGEKRIHMEEKENASSSGEGMYWKYESTLRKWDGRLYSVMGAAGELFSIRTRLFESIDTDTLIEDFVMTMSFLRKGYRIAYEPEAYAVEEASENSREEMKRKIRISAGGLQASWRLRDLLNPFKYPVVSFQLFSHRVMRWTLAPLALLILAIVHPLLAFTSGGFYAWTLIPHLLFYLIAGVGGMLADKKLKIKGLYIPYYFLLMNTSVYWGLVRLIRGKQTTVWEKARRKSSMA
jgi:biofilm PGA synthesis N-glycosyltransferase PgaC